MKVDHVPCGDFANESERAAVERLKPELSRLQGAGNWVILSNVPHAVTTQAVPDDVDLIVIGPSGLHIIEVKHWDRSYVKEFQATVTHEADKLCNKVRRIASKLKRANLDAGFLKGKFLLTKGSVGWTSNRLEVHGCRFFGLKEAKDLLDVAAPAVLSDKEVERICQLLQPLAKVALRGEVRNIASARNLERIGDGEFDLARISIRLDDARTFGGASQCFRGS